MFSITGSRMKQAMSPERQDTLEGVEIVVRHDHRGGDHVGRDPIGAGNGVRCIGRTRQLERRLHRDHHLVVMAVIAALDLGDAVAPGGATSEADGVHRRLRTRVGEPPHRQPVAVTQQFGDLGVEFARGDVEGAVAELRLDRGAHDRVHVPGEQGAEAHVVVGVLVAVDVDHRRPGGVANDDRMRVVGLEARRHAEREDLPGPVRRPLRANGALLVAIEFALADLLRSFEEPGVERLGVDSRSVDRMGGGHDVSHPYGCQIRVPPP